MDVCSLFPTLLRFRSLRGELPAAHESEFRPAPKLAPVLLGIAGMMVHSGPAQAVSIAVPSAVPFAGPTAVPFADPIASPFVHSITPSAAVPATVPVQTDTLTWDDIPWVGIEQALDAGALSTRKILIYVHAPWCPYCRRMNTELLNDPDVQSVIKAYFSPVRINTESQDSVRYFDYGMTEREFAGALRNESLPTLYFMSAEGEVFAHQPGLLPRRDLLKLLHYVGSGAFEEIPFESYSPPDAP